VQSDKSGFLFRSLFIAALPATAYLLPQHDLYRKFSVVGGAFLADEPVGWGNAIVCLRELLQE